jgi:hypothetical protein
MVVNVLRHGGADLPSRLFWTPDDLESWAKKNGKPKSLP